MVRHVTCIGKAVNTKFWRKNPLRRPRDKWEDNIQMNLKETV
jgi:hypothetical protein